MSRAGLILWIIIGLALIYLGVAHAETGYASWYRHGKVTASGERFVPMGMTCARRSHKDMGKRFRVTHLRTGRSIICRQNDYGPHRKTGRIIDLSLGAARKLGIVRQGVARVRVERVK